MTEKDIPRITPQDIEDAIEYEAYFSASDGLLGREFIQAHLEAKKNGEDCAFELGEEGEEPGFFPLERLTFCVLILKNGFTVHGHSACVSPELYDYEIGKKIARQKAVDNLYPLLAFQLTTTLSNEQE